MMSLKEADVVMSVDVTADKSSTLSISGVNQDLLRDPERVRKIMEILELPEGTKALVRHVGADVIVR